MKTYTVSWVGNNGEIIEQVNGMTKEQAVKMAAMETALAIGELDGKYVVQEEITIRQQRYALPEGFTVNPRMGGEVIYDETGRICKLFNSGYAHNDDRPYLITDAHNELKSIPLQPVVESGN